MVEHPLDILVVGGGPVGLYAGWHSALLFLSVGVVDKGLRTSRGFHVPRYWNIPTQPEGISGRDLIRQLRTGLTRNSNYTQIHDLIEIRAISRQDDLFILQGIHSVTKAVTTYISRVVILATGIVDRQPIISADLKTVFPYANNQLLCYCIVCDGHLVNGKNVAVIGTGKTAVETALNLIDFKAESITILTHGKPLFDDTSKFGAVNDLKRKLRSHKILEETAEIQSLFGLENKLFGVRLAGGKELTFQIAFSALGFYKVNNDLAVKLGGQIDETGFVIVDEDCRVLNSDNHPIPGLYAIGDVTTNWKQIMVGFGDADRAILHAWSIYL